VWLAKIDEELKVCETLAQYVPEWRTSSIHHCLLTLVRQRVYQIAAGYEDQNDSNSLRKDPLLKVVLGHLPESDLDLASQPTLSRLENAPDAKACLRIARALGELYVRERGKGGAPSRILLDFDATADPVHGGQEGTYYHGFYGERIYHPLLVFDGETDQLITAVLRPGNTHASRGALAILKRIVGRLREAWPEVEIEIRADMRASRCRRSTSIARKKASATPSASSQTHAWKALAQDLLEQAKRDSEAKAGEKVRLISSASYQALSWDRTRRVIYKAEVLEKGTNTHFVVTSRSDEPKRLYDWYVRRGQTESWIKDFTRWPSRPIA
jgi:hypothetical protein